jgi:Predicted transmembrane transcriptional regulator (anti-sigma factor)
MNCTEFQDRFAELLDGRLAESDTAAVRAHLASCPQCQREYASLAQTLSALDNLPTPAPSPRLRANFYAMLEEEKNSATSIRAAVARRQRASRASLWRWILSPAAALALALAGFYTGTHYATPAATPAPVVTTDAETKREIAELRAQVDKMGQAFVASLLQQQSTNERLHAVLTKIDQKNPDQKDLAALVGALALDPSVNVRLSALDALYPHAESELVRNGVLASLPREQNPLVQVAMIDFLVAARERNATPELQKLAHNQAIDAAVRDAAKRGLAQL